jgi:hypothetical protein
MPGCPLPMVNGRYTMAALHQVGCPFLAMTVLASRGHHHWVLHKKEASGKAASRERSRVIARLHGSAVLPGAWLAGREWQHYILLPARARSVARVVPTTPLTNRALSGANTDQHPRTALRAVSRTKIVCHTSFVPKTWIFPDPSPKRRHHHYFSRYYAELRPPPTTHVKARTLPGGKQPPPPPR